MTADTADTATTTIYSKRAEELRAMGLQITTPAHPRKVFWTDADEGNERVVVTQRLDASGAMILAEAWNDPEGEYEYDRAFMDRYGLSDYIRKAQADEEQDADAEAGDAPAFGTQVPDSPYAPRDIVGIEQAPAGNGILRVLRERTGMGGARYYEGHAHIVLTPAECRKAAELLTEIADEADADKAEAAYIAEGEQAETREDDPPADQLASPADEDECRGRGISHRSGARSCDRCRK